MQGEFPEPNWPLDPRPQRQPKIFPRPTRERFRQEFRVLVDAKGAGELLRVWPSQIQNFRKLGRLPLPIRLESSVRWIVEELRAWAEAACPSCQEWERIKAANPLLHSYPHLRRRKTLR